MRVLILTSNSRGPASLALPILASRPGIELVQIVFSNDEPVDRSRSRSRQLNKVRKIGLFGAINGVRLRRWYGKYPADELDVEPLHVVANRLDVPMPSTPRVNCQQTIDLFYQARADVAVSLGTSYIPASVFQIPRFGMVNVHHERLPAYPGAQSIIWPIFEGSTKTGYTIHQINRDLDAGPILWRAESNIEFRGSLKETVVHNYSRLWVDSVAALCTVLERFPDFLERRQEQRHTRSFTTPSARQFLTMLAQHRRLRRLGQRA